jgi:thiamine transporter ThiT
MNTSIQLSVMIICIAVAARRGFQLSDDHVAGALIGGFVGLLVGLIASGIILTVEQLIPNHPLRRIRAGMELVFSSKDRSEK